MREYFNWLCDRISWEGVASSDYSELLFFLFNTEFKWIIPNDKNRADDGLYLRDEYPYSYLVHGPCNVLEMLVALASRCENDIMHDPYGEDESGRWFWMMLDNLGLLAFDNTRFNPHEVKHIISVWMDRKYRFDGEGSLFPFRDPDDDIRYLEIWSQLNRYLNEHFVF